MISNGGCEIDPTNINGPSDEGCARWDWDNQLCLECSIRWRFDITGKCQRQDNNCKSFGGITGGCVECFKGYELQNNVCVVSQMSGPIDSGCARWNWDSQVCLECSVRFIFDSQGKCVPVDNFCQEYDSVGSCTSCYKGYEVMNGKCVEMAVNIVGPTDKGCKTWDWDNQVCLECSFRYVFNSENKCVQVSDNCKDFDASTGVCQTCYSGYSLIGLECVMVNPLCKTTTVEGTCGTCYDGFILYKGSCTPLSKIADIALYYAECCPEKLLELRENGRIV